MSNKTKKMDRETQVKVVDAINATGADWERWMAVINEDDANKLKLINEKKQEP